MGTSWISRKGVDLEKGGMTPFTNYIKPLLFRHVIFHVFLVSVVVCELGKIEELYEVQLWH